jgi:hypothetical protein
VLLASLLLALSTTTFHAQASGSGLSLATSERIGGQSVASVAVAASGNVWAVGGATFNPVTPTSDALQPSLRGAGDAFLVELRPDGTVAYATYLGGSGYDFAKGVAVDAAGNVYVVGRTASSDFPTTRDAFQPGSRGDDGFLTKLSPDGRTILYSTYLGGSAVDEPAAVAVDAGGRVYLTGNTYSADFPRTADAVRTSAVGEEVFYTRFSASGTIEYSTLLGGSGGDVAGGLAVDAAGNTYLAGYTSSPDFTLRRAMKAVYPSTSGSQGFLAKFTAAGLDFSTYVGGSNSDQAYAVAVSGTGVYVGGLACSGDFPGAPRPGAPASACAGAAFVSTLRTDGSAVVATVLFDGSGFDDRVLGLATDSSDNVYATGYTNSRDFPTTPDAQQVAPSAAIDAFFAKLSIADPVHPAAVYVTYLGGTQNDYGFAAAADGAGGSWIGGWTNSSADFPSVGGSANSGAGFVARYAQTNTPPPASDDVVLYARNATSITGNWRLVADATAAASTRIENPDAGAGKIGTAAAAPANYFELSFNAQAGVPYHLWLRMKAQNDSWTNDSLFVQFSDSVDAFGNPIWRIGTTNATVVSLEDCTGCGEHGWGWNDNGYDAPGALVIFATSGPHTLRVQQREDGISLDQVVLSTRTYINAAPGAKRDDTTILDATGSGSDPNEAVLYSADASAIAGSWSFVDDPTAAAGKRLFNPDAGAAKLATAAASPVNYFEVTFTAQAGVPYHLWLRMRADSDAWQNDSVFVQFSDSVDASGNSVWRVGSTSATIVSLEDCTGCGEQGWGWNDNGYDSPGVFVTFAANGTHTLRVQQREDGVSIDQIVLSAAKYLTAAPGAAKNDTTIVSR